MHGIITQYIIKYHKPAFVVYAIGSSFSLSIWPYKDPKSLFPPLLQVLNEQLSISLALTSTTDSMAACALFASQSLL